jgi:hypothetical protein
MTQEIFSLFSFFNLQKFGCCRFFLYICLFWRAVLKIIGLCVKSHLFHVTLSSNFIKYGKYQLVGLDFRLHENRF